MAKDHKHMYLKHEAFKQYWRYVLVRIMDTLEKHGTQTT